MLGLTVRCTAQLAGLTAALRPATGSTCTQLIGALTTPAVRFASSTASTTTTSASAHSKPHYRLGVIGSGKMATAMVSGILASEHFQPSEVLMTDINPTRLKYARETLKTDVDNSPLTAVQQCEQVLVAVKPQSIPTLASKLSGKIPEKTLLISVVAGYELGFLTSALQHSRVVRAMPNTPAQIRKSMTVWTATDAVDEATRASVQTLFQTFGSEIYVGEESYLDMATALSGTGPAYILLILEALIDCGVHLGLSRDMSKQLVIETVAGTAAMANSTTRHPSDLRNDITSPGGTTSAALYAAERGGLRTVLSDSMWAAYRRALEMGERSSTVGPGRFHRTIHVSADDEHGGGGHH